MTPAQLTLFFSIFMIWTLNNPTAVCEMLWRREEISQNKIISWMSSFPDRSVKWNNERSVSWNNSVVNDANIFHYKSSGAYVSFSTSAMWLCLLS